MSKIVWLESAVPQNFVTRCTARRMFRRSSAWAIKPRPERATELEKRHHFQQTVEQSFLLWYTANITEKPQRGKPKRYAPTPGRIYKVLACVVTAVANRLFLIVRSEH